ncbi:uncharacterized protein [Polyergus mexicanus]|uniref:uncharacterized protein n=1 Tax=Polyergus mexicanus TaxID=615972 RepID=UPI0038B5C9EE
MNSDIQPVKNNTSKYENLKKGQIYKYNNTDDLQVIRGISDTRRVILDNLNQSTEQKSKSSLAPTSYISSSSKNISSDKNQIKIRKLVDSKQVSGPFHQSDKKTFLLDSYARIAATNNRRCPKRMREFAKPKRQARSNQNDYSANFDLNYGHATKTYMTEIRRSLKESKKK